MLDVLELSPLIVIDGLVGAVVSVTTRLVLSEAIEETLPAVSLYQTKTVLRCSPVDSALVSVKSTLTE